MAGRVIPGMNSEGELDDEADRSFDSRVDSREVSFVKTEAEEGYSKQK